MEENKENTGKKSIIQMYIENVHHKAAMKSYNLENLKTDESFNKNVSKLSDFFNLSETEVIYFAACYNYYFLKEPPSPFNFFDVLADAKEHNFFDFYSYIKDFNSLIAKGFITLHENVSEEEIDTSEVSLSSPHCYIVPYTIGLAVNKNDTSFLKKLNTKLTKETSHASDYILPESIKEKKLFYPESIKQNIEDLTNYLQDDKIKLIQKRFKEKGLPSGICIIFQGAPGTGKTETVYQIAKKTNRAILHIDLGSVISKWIGETENNISKVFKRYNKLYETSCNIGANVPILLFNEADAVFGKRAANTEQASQVNENHIQSILLDNIERQKGIFIATTNVIEQFDPAYDRRFLFKIRFNKPDLEVSKLIWKDKFDWLSDEDITTIAKNYIMTGGQIDNILRKTIMQEVLNGRRCTVDEILDYCKKEKFETDEKAAIGFNND